MAEKPPLPPKPKPPQPPRPRPKPPAAAAARPPPPPAPRGGAPATNSKPPPAAAPPFKKPSSLAPPPPQVFGPLKPPPAHQYRQHPSSAGGGGARKPRHRPRHRGGGACSCRRVCCLATGLALLALCLALAAACLAYLYYRPRAPSFHLQPLSPVRLRLGNASSSTSSGAAGVWAVDATVGARAVAWNPNERVAFRYGAGEGRVALADADGDVALGWAPVAGLEDHAPRTVAALAFVAAARGVVVDDAVAARVRDRYRRRALAFRVVVDAHVGVRLGALRTAMVPVRLLCDGGVMAPRDGGPGGGAVGGPMSKCQVLLFRVRWFSLN